MSAGIGRRFCIVWLVAVWCAAAYGAGTALRKPGEETQSASRIPATRSAKGAAENARLVREIKQQARERMADFFERQRVRYPPSKVTVLAVKRERLMKIFSPDHTGQWRFVMQYPVAAASGSSGPKLRKGDFQVPEGVYRVTHLNPDSRFHLSLGLDYPNPFDVARAKAEKRTDSLGNEIFIHGSWYSVGCLALGNTAIEDIYTLASDVGAGNMKVVISPVDFRCQDLPDAYVDVDNKWVRELYADLWKEHDALGDAGTSTNSLLVRYADSVPPLPPETEDTVTNALSTLAAALSTMADVAETSASGTSGRTRRMQP